MRIKKLELFGFKSFKDRTVIHFDEGITGIVGPNGCGKSNIVDALVWVMGEMSAKHLRGSAMTDVIFAGAEGFAPMGMAEVSMVLENDGGPFPAKYLKHSEVMVTRRLHRSGESEYLINKEPARLRDIQEIFMDTGAGAKGFSIIEQGAIGKIITAKPEERRTLIEEAAGITKFKVRKRESQRKLVQTDQNLVRLQDIIGEQKRQLDSLQRQAQRAERYRKLKDEAEQKDLWLSSKKYLSIHGETAQAQVQYDDAKMQELTAVNQLTDLESQLEVQRVKVAEKETHVGDLQRSFQDMQNRVVNKENQIREFNFEIEQARRNKEMTGSIVQKYKVRKEALLKDQNELELRLNKVRERSQELSHKYSQKNSEYQNVQERIQKADDELTEKRREMLAVSQSESHLDAKLTSVLSTVSERKERLETEQAVLTELGEKKQEFFNRRKKFYNELEQEKQMKLDITRDFDVLVENKQQLTAQIDKMQLDVDQQKDEHNKVSSRLYGLQDLHANFEGFQEGVKNVMLWQRQRIEQSHADGSTHVEFQPVAEVVEVPAEYELVMEAALGPRLQTLLSQNHEKSLSAVDYLRTSRLGRSSFLASDGSEQSVEVGQQDVRQEEGVKGLLADVVKVPDSYQQSVAHVLSGVVIVDSIRTALKLRPRFSGVTFVTMDGDTLSADGVLTGGTSESAQSGVLKRRREIKELSQRREEAAGKLALAQASLKKMSGQLKSLESEMEDVQQKQVEKERHIVGLEKDYERAENEYQNAERAFQRQQQLVTKEESQIFELEKQVTELKQNIESVSQRKAELEREVAALTDELKNKKAGIDQLQEEVSQLRVDSASKHQELEGLSHQMDMLQSSLSEVEEQLQQMSLETERSTTSLSENQILVEQAQVELEKFIRETKEFEAQLGTAKDEYEQLMMRLKDLEKQVSVNLQGRNNFQAQMNEAQLKLEQLKMKEQYLIDQINERYMKNLSEVAPQLASVEGDLEQVEKELEDLKDKLKRIGEVNLSAIEEYEDLIKRYEFLTVQHQDLVEAKEQLRKVIDRINRICSRRFKDTFEQVNERFEKVFPVLFGGGHARLVLVEDPEKGEMGIDIIAQPPGKKAANVSLLSGGEKALTAVSLIFSIFLVKPSPFCLLDEVDAPLDDANVHRFNDLVKEMAKRSQIIIVTHNKHTMHVNNKLFGVTQENKGVSKMVSVSLEEAQKAV